VDVAKNGKDGVDRYATFHPHAVLMDVEMPEMNGFDASRAIVGMDPEARILMLTGIPQGELALRALEQGLVRLVLPKPFRFQQLKMAMDDILRDAPVLEKEDWEKSGAVA
jgi:YesN/AraC family two-component response regulator